MKVLSCYCETPVRFSEVDSLAIVWHGHYLRYFEDGREAFAKKFQISFRAIFEKEGFSLPIVKATCQYKNPLRYGDVAVIETEFVNTPAAKILFNYRIWRKQGHVAVAEGETIQVFCDQEGTLQLNNPDFFLEWKNQWLK